MEGKFNIKFQNQYVGLLGHNAYVARPYIYSTIGTDELVEYAAKAAGIEVANMTKTFAALIDAFTFYLCNGHAFKLDGVGTFSLSLSAVSADPTSESALMGANAVTGLGINFLADKKLKTLLSRTAIGVIPINPNNLPECDHTYVTSFSIGSYSANVLQYPSTGFTKGIAAKQRDKIVVNCCNAPSQMAITIKGVDAQGAQQTETITLQQNSKKTQNGLVGKFITGDNVDIVKVTSVSINGFEYIFNGDPTYNKINLYLNGNIFVSGGVVSPGLTTIKFSGENLSDKVVKLDGVALSATLSTDSAWEGSATLAAGNHTITVGEKSFSVIATSAVSYSVTGLTANGETVANGGTSGMVQGRTYEMIASGTGLNNVQLSDISVPVGSSISSFSASANQVKFNVLFGGTAGELKIGPVFLVNVTKAEIGGTSITSILGATDGGTVEVVAGTQMKSLEVQGTSVSDVTYETNAGTLSGTYLNVTSTVGSYKLYAKKNGVTIFVVNIIVAEASAVTYYTLNVSSANEEMGVVNTSVNKQWPAGEVITIYASAKDGFEFDKWNDGVRTASRDVTMNSDQSFVASFKVGE